MSVVLDGPGVGGGVLDCVMEGDGRWLMIVLLAAGSVSLPGLVSELRFPSSSSSSAGGNAALRVAGAGFYEQ
jgi:hypothetical protein